MVAKFKETVSGWNFDVVSIGFPAPVRKGSAYNQINLTRLHYGDIIVGATLVRSKRGSGRNRCLFVKLLVCET